MWRSLAFAFQAIEVRLRFVAVLVAIGLLVGYWETLRNYWDKWTRPAAGGAAVASDEEFFCGMHPNVVRDSLDPDGSVPECPICGMPLSKRKKGEPEELPPGVLARVQLSPERIQQAGIATVPIEYRPLVREIRTVGIVAFDETRLSRVVTRVDGYVEKLYVDRTFATVAEGDPLAEIYSPELYSAAQELLLARERKLDRLVSSAREKLRLLGVGDPEIDELVQAGRSDTRLVLRSPQQGHVIGKNVVEGSSVERGMTLLEVADLSVVWVEADVYEKDVVFLEAGQAIEARVEAYPNRTFAGRVMLVHPHVERETRTNRVRFELENADHALRPGMYATVGIQVPLAGVEPFASQIAERKNRPDASDLTALAAWQQNCPVTGLPLGSMGPPVNVTVATQTVLLCCEGCEGRLTASPEPYLAKLAGPPENAVLAVPREAVIDTGTRKIVYVEREPGRFESVEVAVGPPTEQFYPVFKGLLPGDRVAARGAFLIDAETRLNRSASSTYFGASGGHSHGTPGAPARRPRSDNSRKLQPPREPRQDKHENHEFSAEELEQITKLAPADQTRAIAQKLCPITGEPLGSMGVPYKLSLAGRDVFLCCIGCESKARSNPESVVEKVGRRAE